MTVSAPDPAAKVPVPDPPARQVLPDPLVVLVWAAQGFVGFATYVMGLVWAGPTHVAAVLLALVAFVPLAWLAARRRRVVVLVPVVSAALSVGLAVAGHAHGRATACTDEMRQAVRPLAPPPGTTVEFEGEYVEGCVARARTRLSNGEIVEHYRAELARLGWQETPGLQEASIGTAAVKDGLRLTVDVDMDDGSELLEVVVADPTTAEPCVVNRLGTDASLPRTPSTEIEPGRWAMLASSEALPASVVVRDASGAVVAELQASAPPRHHDDLTQLDEVSGGWPSLLLDEGAYDVECRPGDGAATVLPLRVAWAPPAPDPPEKGVVLRVFEAPGRRD